MAKSFEVLLRRSKLVNSFEGSKMNEGATLMRGKLPMGEHTRETTFQRTREEKRPSPKKNK